MIDKIPNEQREKWRRITEAATPGPWVWRNPDDLRTLYDKCEYPYGSAVLLPTVDYDAGVGLDCVDTDREFIAAARSALPALLDENDDLRRQLEQAQVEAAHAIARLDALYQIKFIMGDGDTTDSEKFDGIRAQLREIFDINAPDGLVQYQSVAVRISDLECGLGEEVAAHAETKQQAAACRAALEIARAELRNCLEEQYDQGNICDWDNADLEFDEFMTMLENGERFTEDEENNSTVLGYRVVYAALSGEKGGMR